MNVKNDVNIKYDPAFIIDSTNTESNIALVVVTKKLNSSIIFINNCNVNITELESSNVDFNLKLNNEIHTKFTSNSLQLFNDNLSINKNAHTIDFNLPNTMDNFNFNKEITICNLKIPTLDPLSNQLNPNVLPKLNKSQYAFKSGRNVGFGTDNPQSKVHITNGDLLLEGGRIGINFDLRTITPPQHPLHIRNGHNNDIAIRVDDVSSTSTFIVYADKPSIGIGTNSISNSNISLYAKNDIHCRNVTLHGGIISTINNQNIDIHTNLLLSNYDILFDGLSLRNTVFNLFGSSNVSFGRNVISEEYRLDVLNETKNVASFGNSNSGDSLISFYNNNSFENTIDIGKDLNSNFKIEFNDNLKFEFHQDGNINIIKNHTTFSVLRNIDIPFNVNIENTTVLLNEINSIKSIVCNNSITFILFTDGTVFKLGLNGTTAEKVSFFASNYLNVRFIGLKYDYLYIITDNDIAYYHTISDYTLIIFQMQLFESNIRLLYRIQNAFVYVLNGLHNEIIIWKNSTTFWSVTLSDDIKKITTNSQGTIFYILTESNEIYKITFNNQRYTPRQIHTITTIKDISGELILYNDKTISTVTACNIKLSNMDERIENALFIYNDTIANSSSYLDESNDIYIKGIIVKTGSIIFQKVLYHSESLYPTFNNITISDKHYIATDGIDIFTGCKDIGTTRYDGLGRRDASYNILQNINLNTNNNIALKLNNSLCIGNNFKFIKKQNILQNTLNVESYCGIGTYANSNYMLTVKGNINIIDGAIYQNGTIVGSDAVISTTSVVSTPSIDLSFYVKHDYLEEFYDKSTNITSNINLNYIKSMDYMESNYVLNSNISNIVTNIFNTTIDITGIVNEKLHWQSNIDCNVIYILNKSVAINASNVTNNIFNEEILPALYVGNGKNEHSNIRGFICEDDIAAFSDISLKKDIKQIENALDKVNNLTGVTYLRKDYTHSKEYMGLIAQEVETVIPQVVGKLNDIKTVSYGNIVALLIESIKELHILLINK
jgi:hypothetical protein